MQSSVTMPLSARQGDTSETLWAIGNTLVKHTGYRGAVDDVRVWRKALNASEVAALYRCGSGVTDLTIPGRGAFFFLPVFDQGDAASTLHFLESAAESTPVRHTGNDFAGVQFAAR